MAITQRALSGNELAESVWQSFDMSDVVINWQGERDNQMACPKWRWIG